MGGDKEKKKEDRKKQGKADRAENILGPACAAELVPGCIHGNYSLNVSAEEAGDCPPH